MAGLLQRWLVLLAALAMFAVNTLAATAGLGGVSTGEVAARYDLPFTPAGYTFAIWGFIYLGLGAFAVFQLVGAGARSPRVAGVRPAFVFSAAANGAWLWFWHHEALIASLVVMLLLLGSLAAIRRGLAATTPADARESWFVDAPLCLYFGWITVAALANLSVVAVFSSRPLLEVDPTVWSLAMIASCLAIAAAAFSRLRDPILLAVICWAAVGVALKPGQAPLVSVPAMLVASLSGLGVIGLLLADGQGTRPWGEGPPRTG